MDSGLILIQFLNGLQLGILLFLLAAGLTLVFGIMDFVNLAHGSLYMMGAFFVATLAQATDSFLLAVLLSIPAVVLLGIVVELIAVRTLYSRDHLDQVLATFGLILFFDGLVHLIWGANGMTVPLPAWLEGQVEMGVSLSRPSAS
jgi:branched-chain amino acid transport system permease protein